MIRVGVDAGGTFTDFVAVCDEEGATWTRELKLPSHREDPASVVLDALTMLGLANEKVELVFSTTAATNAILERRGGPTVLLTTAGFEDVLEIGRQARPELYALEPQKQPPLVEAANRIGVAERTAFDRSVLKSLTETEIDRVRALVGERGATIAISFLHSYANPAHEQHLAAVLRERGLTVSVSSVVCPLPREYERTSTTVVDAYVTPTLGTTLAKLRTPSINLRVMESSGGARASVRPARTVLSGPAAGVIAAEALARRRKLDRVMALDMGGTSTDLALIRDGVAARVEELHIAGVPIALPSIAVRTVGAGGGSVAWLDAGGALKVGPRSAGASPGPAAYGRGGNEPTVTDAHVVLGHLGPTICGGTVALSVELARTALQALADAMSATVKDAARAIIAVTEAKLSRAIRSTSLGDAPGRLALVVYGGAAGLHAVAVARSLGIGHVIVPPAPGLQCALGALGADVVVEEVAACKEELGESVSSHLVAELDRLAERATRALIEEGVAADDRSVERRLRARYEGQGIDAELELSASPISSMDRATFERAHQAAYGYRLSRKVEIVRLSARGVGRARAVTRISPRIIGWPRRGSRDVDGVMTPIYRRDRLRSATIVKGPAIIEELSATFYLPKGASASVDRDGSLDVTP